MQHTAQDLEIKFKQNSHVFNTFKHDQSQATKAIELIAALYDDFQKNDASLPSDKIAALAKLPNDMLLYLMVEVRLMIEENGPFKFEDRETGCLKAFFKALCVALETITDLTISEQLFKQLHKIITDPKKVNNDQIDDQTSGEYRPLHKIETLSCAVENISEDGVLHLINMIEQDVLPGLKIASENDYLERYPFNFDKHLLPLSALLLKHRDEIDTANSETVLESINNIANKKYIVDPPFAEKELLDILKATVFDVFFEEQNLLNVPGSKKSTDENDLENTWQYGLWDIADLIKRNDSKNNLAMLKTLISQNALNFFANKNSQKEPPTLLISKGTLQQLKKHYRVDNRGLAKLLIRHIEQTNDKFTMQFPPSSEVKKLMDVTIQSFNDKVKDLKDLSPDQKLFFIFEHIQRFLLIHPFIDANNRVFVNALANRLLVQHGFTFAVYFNPLVFYAHSIPDVVKSVKLAQANYLAMQATNEGKDTGFVIKIGIDNPLKEERVADMTNPVRHFFLKLRVIDSLEKLLSEISEEPSQKAFFEKSHEKPNHSTHIYEDIQTVKNLDTIERIKTYLDSRIKLYETLNMGLIADQYKQLMQQSATRLDKQPM